VKLHLAGSAAEALAHPAKKWEPVFCNNDASSKTWSMMPDSS